jgi:hypothetical protein
MELQKIIQNKEEYTFYKETDKKHGPHFLVVPQQYPNDIYVDVPGEKQKIPLALQIYIGGLSIIGLFIVYRMLQKSSRNE